MAVQVNPITQSLPATTAIQDPATRRFAQAVEDALRALRSEEGAVESLKKAADAMNGAISGGTPPSIAQWLFSSELHQKLTTEIARVDIQAKQDVIDEALARQTAIDEINATLATIQSTAAYDPFVTYAVGDMVTYDGKLYQAILETTGNLPTNTTYWKKVGDYATLGDVVAAHTLEINDLESRVTTDEGNLTAEIANRQALATQVRGTYTGTDVALVTQGLMYSERVARSTADSTEVAKRESLSAKILGTTNPDGLTLNTLSEGLIFDERQARVGGDEASASSISALRAQVGVTEAGALTTGLIMDEKNVRASNDLAIVSAVNTALAQITGVSTSISQSGENLIANWTTAQADKWSQIESEVLTSGGQTIRAALLQESQTRANADGSLGAQWTLKTDINGYISGFGFASTANNAAPMSEFIIRADKFAVVMPGYGEHVPFAIGPSGASFVGAQNTGGVAQPFEGWSLGSQTLVSVSDGKVGNTVLRLGAAGSYPTQTSFVPIDPTKKYRVRFWARPSSDCNGLLYFSLRQAVNETGAWGPTNGGRAPYKPSGQTRAAHNSTYGTGAWGEYSYIWDAADWQAGVKFFRPEFLDNYGGTAGYWEVQGLVVEEATNVEAAKDAANAAQLSANTANNTLADIAADNKLTAVEKQSAMNEWGIINRERASIQSQADALGILQERWDYDYVYAVLNDYITPLLQDISSTSVIDGATFRDKWSYFYEYRQRLINKMAAVAATKADWSSVTGSGKPENGATVGADWNSNLLNRPSNSQLLNNLLDTSTWSGPSHGGVAGFNPNGSDYEQYRRSRTLPDGSQGISWYCYPGIYYNNAYGWDNPLPNASPAGDADGGWNSDAFPVTASRGYRFSVWVCHTGGNTGTAYLGCGGGSVRDMGGGAVNNNPYFVINSISGLVNDRWYLFVGYVHPENRGAEGQTSLSGIYDGTTGAKVATGTDYCWAPGATTSIHRAYLYYSAAGSHIDFVWPRVDMLNGMEPSLAQLLAMGAVSARNPITPSNVTTYIANAAIGNAQIGGDLWSTNHVAGSAGWRIYRDGNAEFRNVTVRGDVEASSLKAGVAMVNSANIVIAAVDTLQIAGNAITVPVSADGTSSCQTATANFGGAPVALVVTGIGRHSHGSIGGGYINKYLRVYRNGGLIKTIQTSNYYYGGSGETETWNSSGAWVITDYPGPGSFYYTISFDDGTSCSVLAIGVKR